MLCVEFESLRMDIMANTVGQYVYGDFLLHILSQRRTINRNRMLLAIILDVEFFEVLITINAKKHKTFCAAC